jgi:ketosteroid isomerase-like protein
MDAADRVDVLQRLYAALDADDIPAFLELCAADAVIDYPAKGLLPYGGTWRGHEGIVEFLDRHEAAEEILDFDVGDMVADDRNMLVLGFFRGRAKRTGRTWETRFVHVMTVADGQLQRWEGYFDSAAALEAHRWGRENV